jgi:predicted dehydrogenase
MGRSCIVAAVSDVEPTRAERARALTRSDLCANWQDLVTRNDIDAVVVATPDPMHAPMTIAAVRAGKDVYCETPMACSIEEAVAMKHAAASLGRRVQIGAQGIAESQWHTARAILSDGALGALTWCQSSCPMPKDSGVPSWRDRWETSGGIASDAVFNRMAALLTCLGVGIPDRVSVAGGVYARRQGDVPDSFVITFEYADGPKVVLTSANAHRNGAPTVIRGRHATLHLDDTTAFVEDYPAQHRNLPLRSHTLSAPQAGLLDDWLDAIRRGATCAFGPDNAFPVMVAAAMANDAYRRGRAVSYDAKTAQIIPSPLRTGSIA